MARTPFLLRIDEQVLAAVKRMAEADLRSLNAQIEYLLREAVAKRNGGKAEPPKADEPEPPDE